MEIAYIARRAVFSAGQFSNKALRSFFSLVISPAPCILCGAQSAGISLCTACRRQLDEEAVMAVMNVNRCRMCGRPLLSEHGICTTCRVNPLFEGLDGVYPLFTYILSKKKLLYSWKIAWQHNLTEVFAGYLADAVKKAYPECLIVPVPPRPGKIRKTGWDQIEDLSRFLELKHGLPVMRLLRRTEAVQQKKLSKEERAEHSKHSYVLDEKAVCRIEGRLPEHVVLIDDVITTGSTVSACATVLKEAGIKKVSAVSLFIVPG